MIMACSAGKEMTMNSYNDIWKVILSELSQKYSAESMKLWFNKFELVYLDDTYAFITTPDTNFLSILNKNYSGPISNIFESALGLSVDVRIFDKAVYSTEEVLKDLAPEKTEAPVREEEKKKEYFGDSCEEKDVSSDKKYTFESFVVGSSNKLAYAASVAVANHPAQEYNPLLIYGASGLGKTHLMKAIANDVSKNHPEFKIMFVTGEYFTNELLDHLSKKTMSQFKEKYRSVDMLFVDDIQFIAGKAATQEEFFYTFNGLYEAHKQIVLTSDRPPLDMANLEERIRTRFEGGLIADIQPPDTELRMAIFKSKAEAMKIDLSVEVLSYIAENVKSNVRQIEGVIKRLGAYNYISGSPITVDKAREILKGVISDSVSPSVTAEKIIENISKRYGVSIDDIKGKRRAKDIMTARHISIFVIRRVTELSLQSIGKIFDRDHSTVLSSIEVVTQAMKKDSTFEHEINSIIKDFS